MRQKKYKYNIFVCKPACRAMREKDSVSKPKTLFFLRKNNPNEKTPSSKKLNEYIYIKKKKRM
jgi:hypothetical protein